MIDVEYGKYILAKYWKMMLGLWVAFILAGVVLTIVLSALFGSMVGITIGGLLTGSLGLFFITEKVTEEEAKDNGGL